VKGRARKIDEEDRWDDEVLAKMGATSLGSQKELDHKKQLDKWAKGIKLEKRKAEFEDRKIHLKETEEENREMMMVKIQWIL
jgi:hypothetical protein